MSSLRPLKRKVSITLDNTIVDRIQVLADEDDRNFSQYINLVLRDHISSKETEAADADSPHPSSDSPGSSDPH